MKSLFIRFSRSNDFKPFVYLWVWLFLSTPFILSAQTETDKEIGKVLKDYINKYMPASLKAAQGTPNAGNFAFTTNGTISISNYSSGTTPENLPGINLINWQLDPTRSNLCNLICIFFDQEPALNAVNLCDALNDETLTAPMSFTFKGKPKWDKPEQATITVVINRKTIPAAAATATTPATPTKKQATEIIYEGNSATISNNLKYDKKCRLPAFKPRTQIWAMNFELKEGLIASPTIAYKTWTQWNNLPPNGHQQYINIHLSILK